jgi:hypothetical protein
MKSITRKMKTWGYRIVCIIVIMLISNTLAGKTAEANSNDVSIEPEPIMMIVGESAVVKVPWPAVRVAITDPTVAEVQVLTPNQVLRPNPLE